MSKTSLLIGSLSATEHKALCSRLCRQKSVLQEQLAELETLLGALGVRPGASSVTSDRPVRYSNAHGMIVSWFRKTGNHPTRPCAINREVFGGRRTAYGPLEAGVASGTLERVLVEGRACYRLKDVPTTSPS